MEVTRGKKRRSKVTPKRESREERENKSMVGVRAKRIKPKA